jgi:hypothetical protein
VAVATVDGPHWLPLDIASGGSIKGAGLTKLSEPGNIGSMAMSEEHKAALAQGRKESRAIKAYLEALEARRPGRPVSKESLSKRMDKVNRKLEETDNPLESVELIQSKLDIEKAMSEIENAVDIETLEAGFIEHARSYSDRKGVSYTAWREFGVPAKVLRSAGIKETRRR